MLGFDLSLPFLLAPVGYSRLMHPGGEVVAARAAGAAGTAYILSTISGHKLEDVKAGSGGPVFYQLYLMGGRGAAEAVIDRARVAGFSALVVTIDTPVSGMRERDFRNGMKELVSGGLLAKVPFIPELLSHPGWLISFLRDGGLPGTSERCHPGAGANDARRYRRSLGQRSGHLGRLGLDSRALGWTDRGERRPHRRRRSSRRR